MLQKIRDLVTGWLAIVIVALLIIPFAFWGINYYFGQGTEPLVAVVNDKEIKVTQFQRAFTNYRQQLRALLGDRNIKLEDEFIKQQTVEKLIESEILNQFTRSENLQISDQHVVGVIKGIDVFNTEEGFNRSFYELGVQRLGMPPAVYEAQLKLDMASEQLQSAIVESAFVLKEEARQVEILENQTRNFIYGILKVDDIKDSIEISESEIEDYYKKNKQNFQDPEQVKIAYLELSLDKLAEDVPVNDEMLLTYYNNNKAKYDVPEQRKFNQVLIKVSAQATEGEIEEARIRANEIKSLIDSGKTFKEIAEEHSADPGPQLQVSEHGFTQKAVMPAEIDEKLFAMKAGEISEIIQTDDGFNIIEVVEDKGETTNTFDNVRDQVAKDVRYQQAEEQYFDLSDQMATLVFEHPDTLEYAADAIEVKVQESDFFSRTSTGEGLLANPKIIETSFSPEIKGTGQNSEIIQISDTHLVALRVMDHIPSTVKPLETVKDEITNDIRFLKAGEIQHKAGQKILAGLKQGMNLEDIKSETKIEWQQAEGIKRSDVSIQRAILRAVFNLSNPVAGKPVYDGISLGTGDYAVISLTSVSEPETIYEKDIEEKQKQLIRDLAGTDWSVFLLALRSSADVQVFTDRL